MSRSSVVIAVAIILHVAGGIVAKDSDAGEVKPCTDFFTYSCKMRNSTRSPRRIQLVDLIDNYLFKAKNLSDVENKFYQIRKYCTRSDLKDKKNFLNKFNPSAGGWPAFNKNWKADKFDLQTILAELNSFSDFPGIFRIKLRNGYQYRFRNQLHVEPAFESRLFDQDFEQLVKEKLSNMVDNVDEVISDSRIVEALFVAKKNSTDENILTDYKRLKREIPEIDWDKQFQIMYGEQVPDSFLVEVYQPGLLKYIIQKIFEVEPKVMANYLFYRIVYRLPDFDEDIQTINLLEDVAYDIFRKHLTSETKQELRDMLISFLKTLDNTMNLFADEDKANIEKTINEFVMDEILPAIDNSYIENTYGIATFSGDDCYSIATKLIQTYWKFQSKIYFKRDIDPLYFMRYELKNTLMYHLPPFLDKSSAIHFDVLIWDSLSTHFWGYWNLDKFKPMQQCLENQMGEKLDKREMTEVLKIKIFTKAYFDWAKDKANLLQLEETKYNESSKQVFMERLIARYCNYDSNLDYRLHQSTISGIFENMKEFSEVYNCTAGSRLNPQFACELEFA